MKNIVLVLLLGLGMASASAQEVYNSSGKPGYQKNTKKKKKKGYDPDKLILGGGITFNFGDGFIAAGASPIVGYRITDRFSAGVGVGYLYSQFRDPANNNKLFTYREHIVYPSLWTRFFVYKNFFVSAIGEYDFIFQRVPGYDPYSPNPGTLTTLKENFTNTCLFVGGGYKFPMGGRASFLLDVQYDVLQGKNSPYPTGLPTLVHFGFALGL